MADWNSEKSAKIYGIDFWGGQYFGINSEGNVQVTPFGKKGVALDLFKLTEDLSERGICAPILVRFPDIVKSRVELLSNCFANSIKEYGYKAHYSGVYPIKVNQQRHLVEEIVSFGKKSKLGIECGSKPELLVGLAHMDTPDALVICNGFKDSEYIETALLSRKLGRNTIIVVDRMAELHMIIEAAKKLNIKPKIGFRAKLNSQGGGRWVESSGAKSKFGLTASEIVHGVNRLREENMIDCLELIHFHVGSQIPSIQSVKTAVREGARFYTELYAMGVPLKYLDVGGGLGIDYDGTGRSENSTNYTEQEYANDVVSILQSICDEKGIPHPNIVSESGRFLVAHSAILIFDVLGMNEVEKNHLDFTVSEKDSRLVQDLQYIYDTLNLANLNEYYNDLIEKKRDTSQLYSYGVLSLEQRAKAEDLVWATTTKMCQLAKGHSDHEELLISLEQELSDTIFCNFSVFQSLPDSWALEQLFPVMPIHRLKEEPTRRATIVDLTCDSDGKIDKFIDGDGELPQKYIELHDIRDSQKYYLGAFLTGAYQEILGDLHNLFGDTNAVHVSVNDSGYTINHVVEGDSVSEVLSYVEYSRPELIERIRQACESSITAGTISRNEARLLQKHYEEGLSGYTYLEDPE